MNPYTVIPLDTWPRKEIFEFFQDFENPSYCIVVKINAESAHAYAKEHSESFFLLVLYAILRAANDVPALRRRIENGEIREYEHIGVVTPVMTRVDELFCHAYCPWQPDFQSFKSSAVPILERTKNLPPSPYAEGVDSDDYICASCAPWIHFDGATHASLSSSQTTPLLSWGKMENGRIPFCCKFNHSFVDGVHFSKFFSRIERYLKHPEFLEQPAS